ncbi:MAG: glycosyltransferase, partial [Kiritimatiellia bacterium]
LELSQARQTGLDAVTAPYVYFLDADDLIHPKTLEWMIDAIEKSEVDFVYAHRYEFYESVTFCDADTPVITILTGENYRAWVVRTWCDFQTMVWNKLFRTELLRKIRFPHWFGPHEDTVWAGDFFPCMKSVGEVKVATYAWRQVPTSLSHTYSLGRIFCNLESGLRVRDCWRQYPDIFPQYLDSAVNEVLYRSAFTCLVKNYVLIPSRDVDPNTKHKISAMFNVQLSPDTLAACHLRVRLFYQLLAHGHWRTLRLLFVGYTFYKTIRTKLRSYLLKRSAYCRNLVAERVAKAAVVCSGTIVGK